MNITAYDNRFTHPASQPLSTAGAPIWTPGTQNIPPYVTSSVDMVQGVSPYDRFRLDDARVRMDCFARRFLDPNDASIFKEKYPTGFHELDAVTNGGLYAGLHLVGAVSSLGKSTLALQMAMNFSARKVPVLYFSLEMSALDLTAKIISMQTFLECRKNPKYEERHIYPKTSDMLRTRSIVQKFAELDRELVSHAVSRTEEFCRFISIIEPGLLPMSVDRITDYVKTYTDIYGQHVIVIVDYLQIIAAPDKYPMLSDKQLADYNLRHLGQIARSLDIPMLLISSFNRDAYDQPAALKSFKASGNIEYDSDTLMAIQYAGVGSDDFDADQAKNTYPRKLELCLLKQRYGESGIKVGLDFYAKYNYFAESSMEELKRSCPIEPELTEKQKVQQLTYFDDDTDIEY